MDATTLTNQTLFTIDSKAYRQAAKCCRKFSSNLYYAGLLLQRWRRYALFLNVTLIGQLVEILEHQEETSEEHCGETCGGASECEMQCEGELAQKRDVCFAVLAHLFRGESTGRPELDAFLPVAKALGLQRQWFEQFCVSYVAQMTQVRIPTRKKLSNLLEQSASPLGKIVTQLLTCPSNAKDQAVWRENVCDMDNENTSDMDNENKQNNHLIEQQKVEALISLCHWSYLLTCVPACCRASQILIPLDDLVQFQLTDHDLLLFAKRGHTQGDKRWCQLMDSYSQQFDQQLIENQKVLLQLPQDAQRAAIYSLHIARWHVEQLALPAVDLFAKPIELTVMARLALLPQCLTFIKKLELN